ncbi:response regulator [Pseudobacteriovorax antillogorgiicola]|uniref:Response regulator receiver domain-containing protein n=1 Tax=Pseudobacteriovorax antillogorgiicola TaxID=1513793 RepID=A0A1Y6C9S2_9BACT|nr:response regulator [Pseudobacteriovorax antillogorgiicola]TCS51812.1 response regulator receiver domain-containing protein [Pseudobacteriovorax antillogorgiicola]SMF50193.1 Response regulator receiver domain-containing protein [Pseudobacteriovorax antillogorgiicola]
MERILFVDDSEDIREIYETLLTSAGYDVISANDGEEAFSAYHSKQPAIVLTDIIMPKMCGIGLIKKIRENDSEVPIIAISGDPRQALLSSEAGANLFLEKPFCSTILVENINRHLDLLAAHLDSDHVATL